MINFDLLSTLLVNNYLKKDFIKNVYYSRSKTYMNKSKNKIHTILKLDIKIFLKTMDCVLLSIILIYTPFTVSFASRCLAGGHYMIKKYIV